MANWNRWAVAVGLAGALSVFGMARAQGSGQPNNTAGTGEANPQGQAGSTAQTPSGDTGRSGWSGHAATEPGQTTTGSQGSATGSSASSDTAGSTAASDTSASSSGKVDKKLQDDVQKIHAANQAEIHMGQMGEQQASSSEVKDFAQKLQKDHQKLDDQLTQTAQAAGIQLEGKAAQSEQKSADKEMKKLEGKTGQDFDKAFVSMMVKDHKKDIKDTRNAAKQARKDNQTELAALLDRAATGMQSHLSMAQQLEKTAGKKGARGSTSSGSSSSAGSSGSSKGDDTAPTGDQSGSTKFGGRTGSTQ